MNSQVIVQAHGGSKWLLFENPVEVLTANKLSEVLPQLVKLDAALSSDSLHAAGFICYEAAPAFDDALVTGDPGPLPLLWFGLYEQPVEISEPASSEQYDLGSWQPCISKSTYREACDRIKEEIAQGMTYQVNFTFRLQAEFRGDPVSLFADLMRAQRAKYGAYIDLGNYAICSASPELFFLQQGNKLVSMPMKGTVGRGLSIADDEKQARWLERSPKNRAENVMILDMIRNDLGRISEIGSVHVPKLFQLERYPTIWQMTSTVESASKAPISEIMKALFPCASITGAPKVSTMKIIASLESMPRGVYTGCIGYISPNRQAQFNVAIRTTVIDKEAEMAEYGVGGGIVWDSEVEEEYQECLTKSLIVRSPWPQFSLLETMLWTPEDGFFLLEAHLKRIAKSANYFVYPIVQEEISERLGAIASTFQQKPQRVRLLLDSRGQIDIESSELALPTDNEMVKIKLATEPIDTESLFLYHKTTNRSVYDNAFDDQEDCDDVLLWNERGEITETTTANAVFQIGNLFVTPPVRCGLLAGTYREQLLEEGIIQENVTKVDDLAQCEQIFLINSVRKWREAELISSEKAEAPLSWPKRSRP
jgi:para-aminobenzoate synthetase/4-amino-4-deoxychorismate lyase